MGRREDQNWELIGSMLAAESSGKSPRLFASRRSLFGIPSALDEELAALSKEAERQAEAIRHEAQSEKQGGGAEETEGTVGAEGKSSASFAGKEAYDETLPATPRSQKKSRITPAQIEHPFDPVFDEHSRVLILGTIPSPKSRETGFYYNHPQNRFWKVLAALFNEEVPTTNDEKRALVLSHGIALWDVLASCEIEGAKDSSIAHCVPNDIDYVLGRAPIERIFCTGAKAAELYKKYCFPQTHVEGERLPSTSAANAATSLEELINAYRVILK